MTSKAVSVSYYVTVTKRPERLVGLPEEGGMGSGGEGGGRVPTRKELGVTRLGMRELRKKGYGKPCATCGARLVLGPRGGVKCPNGHRAVRVVRGGLPSLGRHR